MRSRRERKGESENLEESRKNEIPKYDESYDFYQTLENQSKSRNYHLISKKRRRGKRPASPLGFRSAKIRKDMETEKNNGWGGARKGAGRKKVQGRDVAISARVSLKAKANLEAWAAAQGIPQQEAINRLLEGLGD